MKAAALIRRIPVGMMLVPVFLGALCNTFCPGLLAIGDPFTVTFTKSGLMTIIGLMLFFTGTQMDFITIRKVAKRGLPLALFKLLLYFIFGTFMLRYMPAEGIFQISSLAWITAYMSCNSALYLSIVNELGDSIDQANFGLMTLIGLPNIALLLFSFSSQGNLINSLLAMLRPLLLGIDCNLLDSEFKEMFKDGTQCLIPLAGFAFGTNISLITMFECGFQGLLLCGCTLLLSLIPALLFDCLILKQPGHAAIASCGLSGVSLSLPYLAAQINPAFEPYVGSATAQCALALVITTFALPYLTRLWAHHREKTNVKAVIH